MLFSSRRGEDRFLSPKNMGINKWGNLPATDHVRMVEIPAISLMVMTWRLLEMVYGIGSPHYDLSRYFFTSLRGPCANLKGTGR